MLWKEQIYVVKLAALLDRNKYEILKQIYQAWNRHALNDCINPLNAELNPVRHLLAVVGAHHIVHVSRLRVKLDRYCGILVSDALIQVHGYCNIRWIVCPTSECWNSEYTVRKKAATSSSKLLLICQTPNHECESNSFSCTPHKSTETLPSLALHKLVASLSKNSYKNTNAITCSSLGTCWLPSTLSQYGPVIV